MSYDVIVVGGGASGMTAAIFAARRGLKTAIVEHKERLGKKILATGNGKCNYTNLYQSKECYRGTNPEFAMAVLRQFDQDQTIAFFRSLGVEPKVKNGYVYPNSEQASAITEVLSMELARLKVKTALSNHIVSIRKADSLFYVGTETYEYEAHSVILATGGCAATIHGSDGSGYDFAKAFGHMIIKPFPALVALKAGNADLKSIAGVRMDAKGSMESEGTVIALESGEFLFTEYGISGIPIFQMSRYAIACINEGKQVTLCLDFFSDTTTEELHEQMKERVKNCENKSMEEFFIGLLNQKLGLQILKAAKCNIKKKVSELTDNELKSLVFLLKKYTLKITGSNGLDQAQVSAGGVNTKEVDNLTMESKLIPGLYLVGELLDVDGTCGGYNLQWAWSSGAIAGKSVKK